MKTRSLIAVLFITVALAYCARAAGAATNVVTLVWDAPTNSPVPFVYEVQQALSLTAPVWTTVAANIPSTQTNLQLTIDRDLKFWRMRSVNATNTAWVSDFSNVASTLWPPWSDGLRIRLGP
jgi:hypothetical protein